MDPELKQSLEEVRAFAKDNNQMLRAIRRHQWYGMVTTVVFWLVIFLAPLYLYQRYAQPAISNIFAPLGVATNAFGLPTFAGLQKLISSYKAGQ